MAWDLLLTSDIGLFSLFTIVCMIVGGIYFLRYAARHVKEDEKASAGVKQMPGMR